MTRASQYHGHPTPATHCPPPPSLMTAPPPPKQLLQGAHNSPLWIPTPNPPLQLHLLDDLLLLDEEGAHDALTHNCV